MEYEDTYKHQGLRRQLINILKKKGIHDQRVLEAIMKVPRHLFMDSAFLQFAYEDKAFPIGADQTISQPYTVAFQTELLEVEKRQKVLEIGTGSGYQTAVLCELGARVFTIERQKLLFKNSQKILNDLGYRPRQFYGDGYKGLPSFAPFDKILITCGAPNIPETLVDQLKPGGIMIIPLGEDTQRMMRIEKSPDGKDVTTTEHGLFRFVPMLPNRDVREI